MVYLQVKNAGPYQNFLLMGDAGLGKLNISCSKTIPELKVDVLVLGHHGSQHSSAYQFLEVLQPKLGDCLGWEI